jgi:D-arginine dehydrogenase
MGTDPAHCPVAGAGSEGIAVTASRTQTADLLVVGGGVIGAWTAYQALRRNRSWRVTLVERATIGGGTTAWSAGVSFPLAATPEHVPLVRASATAYADLLGTPAAAHIRDVRMTYVTADPTAFAERVVDATLRPLTPAEQDEVAAVVPDARLGSDDSMLTHDGHGFAVAAAGLAGALVAECGPDLTVLRGAQVTQVRADSDGFAVFVDDTCVRASRVVLACGPWTPPPVHPEDFPDLPGARRKRIAALHVRTPSAANGPLVSFVDDDVFVLPDGNGSALVSFYREEWDPDPDALDGRPVVADIAAGAVALAHRSRILAAAVTGGRAFCDLYTPHRLPQVITHPSIAGIAAVRGGSGSGVRLAPALANAALDAVAGHVDAQPQPAGRIS